MREFHFELALAAHLEGPDRLLARQVGGHVHGRRIVDLAVLVPGPNFADRAAITEHAIPPVTVESDVGAGRATDWRQAIDGRPEYARTAVERAVEVGFFEHDRSVGPHAVRQTARYPDRWFDRLIAVENKPDLGRPGDLETQLLTDAHLALFDEVVLATASHVTGAHLNRVPEAVGVWRFDPESGERMVVREPTALPVDEAGVEILERTPARTDVAVATAGEKRRTRRRLAERIYGKGWRPGTLPACATVEVDRDGLPFCPWAGRYVRPATDCSPACGGHDPADPPEVDLRAIRDDRTPWRADPPGRSRRQAGLDRFQAPDADGKRRRTQDRS